MSSALFGAFAVRASFTDQFAHSYAAAPGSPYNCSDGSNVIGINSLYGALSGKGASRSAVMYAGGAAVGIGVASAGSAADTGWQNTGLAVTGAGATLEYGYQSMSGQCYFGRGANGSGAAYNNAGLTWTGNIGLYINYIYTPSGPGLAITPSADGASALATPAAAADNGGSAATGYTLQIADDSGFTTNVRTISISGPTTVTSLNPGQRYYARAFERNALTDAHGVLGGAPSGTVTFDQPASGFGQIHNGTAFVDADGLIFNGTMWVPSAAKIFNASSAWVDV